MKTVDSAEEYLKRIQSKSREYSGFNLLVGEINHQRSELFYYSNRSDKITKLSAGIYGLSNALLDTPWQKVEKGKRFLAENSANDLTREDYFRVLADETLADDTDLPDTGVGIEREKILSAVFIKTPVYGTRCSSVLTFNQELEFNLEERVFV